METFKNEYEYLIHLVKCALQDKQPQEKPENLSFNTVFEYGKDHEVANIAFIAVQKLHQKPDDELYIKWKTIYAFSIQRHANQMNARGNVVAALSNAEIRHMEVQGTIMKALYPYPEWRMMSDIDFIVDKENLEKAETVLKTLEYDIKHYNSFEVSAYGKNGIAVELHPDFFDSSTSYGKCLSNAFQYAVPGDGPFSFRVNETIFYLYTLLHALKHYLLRGTGIRRIMDLYILKEKLSDKVDLPYINRILQESGHKEVTDQLFCIAEKWFGDSQITVTPLLSEAEKTIYLSNNHGNDETQWNNEYKTFGKSKWLFKLYKGFALTFPSKESIYKAYPFCKKHNYPLVLCWIHRGFCVLFSKERQKSAIRAIQKILKMKIFK